MMVLEAPNQNAEQHQKMRAEPAEKSPFKVFLNIKDSPGDQQMRETSKFGNSNTPPIYPDPKPPSNIPVYKRFDRQKSKSQEAIAKVEENKFM